MLEQELTEDEYRRQIEVLARAVVDAAGPEGWLSYQPDPPEATPLQKAVNELARQLRHWHFKGDGPDGWRPRHGLGVQVSALHVRLRGRRRHQGAGVRPA